MPSDQQRSATLDQQRSAIKPVQEMFKKVIDVPYCTGTVQLNPSQSLLFYRYKDESNFIDFTNPSETQLKALADACTPASFGRNKEDIVDENYRKAGKMDPVDFATQFSPWDSGVLRTAVETLFKTNGSTTNLTVELYKLNVYGPGSFFKAHVDTPCSDAMFGSLVVVLPTHHTGGSLLFRHHDVEYMFDSAHTVSISPTDAPHAAFAAFFSDVEHEVTEVTSGYRVTLTYNLYHSLTSEPSRIAIEGEVQTLSTIRTALAALLHNPDFLPGGGLLAFGLTYEYPFHYSTTRLSDIEERLKGVDALLKCVCEELDLQTSLKAVYYDPGDRHCEGEYAFVDSFVELPEEEEEEFTLLEHICIREHGRTRVYIGYDVLAGRPAPTYSKKAFFESYRKKLDHTADIHCVPDTDAFPVVWAKPLDDKNEFKEKYIAYGNEASMGYAYGQVCLVARVEPASERK